MAEGDVYLCDNNRLRKETSSADTVLTIIISKYYNNYY